MTLALSWIVAAVIFLALDMVWLLWLGRAIYVAEIGTLLRDQPDLRAAALFYVLFVSGLVYFSIWPSLASGAAISALITGAAFGLVAYGTYDLTNLAVAKGFTWRIAMIDMAWGTCLSATTAVATYGFVKLLLPQS